MERLREHFVHKAVVRLQRFYKKTRAQRRLALMRDLATTCEVALQSRDRRMLEDALNFADDNSTFLYLCSGDLPPQLYPIEPLFFPIVRLLSFPHQPFSSLFPPQV